jgi:hypothetical protein
MAWTFCHRCGARVDWAASCSRCGAVNPLYENRGSAALSQSPPGHGALRVLLTGAALLLLVLAIGAGAVAYKLLKQPALQAPSHFRALAGALQVSLEWEPADGNDAVRVVCSTDRYPSSPDEGTLVYEGPDPGCVHDGLEPGTRYYYGIWAVKHPEEQPQYSATGRFDAASPYWVGPMGETEREFVEPAPDTRVVGADDEYIRLLNNPAATDPSWTELKQFLMNDSTDQVVYDDSEFVCADFAEMLHNNAENSGIRAAYVTLDFTGQTVGHAINAFNTTDRGIVYIDDTGRTEVCVCSADKEVSLEAGEEYVPESIFACPGYSATWGSMGTVSDVYVCW